MLGDHCWQCGQPVKGLVRQFSTIIGDFLDSVFDLDARVPRTLGPLLLRPGYLSLQYFEGHRVRYVSPVRLFVFLCIASFFILKLSFDPQTEFKKDDIEKAMTVAEVEAARDVRTTALRKAMANVQHERTRKELENTLKMTEEDAAERIEWLQKREQALAMNLPVPPEPSEASVIKFGTDEPWDPVKNPLTFEPLPDWANGLINSWIGKAQKNIQRIQEEPSLLKDAVMENLPQTFIVLLPLFALLLKLVYLFKRRLYMEHLIVALHGHAFLCVAMLLLAGLEVAANWLGEASPFTTVCRVLEGLVWVWIPVYLWLSQKRVYGQGWLMTTLKFAVVGFCYSILLVIGVTASILISVVTL